MILANALGITVIDAVIGGFAAAAAEAETVTPEVLKANVVDKSSVQPEEDSRGFSGVIGAVGAAILSPIVIPLAATLSGATTMANIVGSGLAGSIFNRAYEIIKSYVSGEGNPITLEEFSEALNYHGLIDKLRQNLREYAQQNKMTESDLYLNVLDKIRRNKAYSNIGDEYKIKLAIRLTEGLL